MSADADRRIDALLAKVALLQSHLDTAVIALSRAHGVSEARVRLDIGIDQPGPQWAEDAP